MKKLSLLIVGAFLFVSCDRTPEGNKGILPVTYDGIAEEITEDNAVEEVTEVVEESTEEIEEAVETTTEEEVTATEEETAEEE